MNTKQAILESFSFSKKEKSFNIHEQVIYGFWESYRSILFLLFLCLAPVFLIWLKIIPFEYRFFALLCMLAGLACFCVYRQYSFAELGFRTDNLTSSLVWNLIFCVVGGIGLVFMHKAGFSRPEPQSYLAHRYLFYIFVLGPLQELIFRGMVFSEVKRIPGAGNRLFLSISTLSFFFLHIIYYHPPLLFIALISGLAWGIIFIKKHNIWGIALSHSLLGALAMGLDLI